MGIGKKITDAFKKTHDFFSAKLNALFKKGELSEEFFEELEFSLISADIGVKTTQLILEKVKTDCKKQKIKTQQEFKSVLKSIIVSILNENLASKFNYPMVLMIVGVNGVGKTTTLGKLSYYFKNIKKRVVLVAGDTFRAAATEQLTEWSNRSKTRIVKQNEGADSASVVFDAIKSAKAKFDEVVLIDTAGRLHNKQNLMDELKKISRIVEREWSETNYKKYIVLDATTGQNAITQVKMFDEAIKLDGIILTKLDGTAKGGIIIPIVSELKIPVVFIGVGEKIEDLMPFDAKQFVDAIL